MSVPARFQLFRYAMASPTGVVIKCLLLAVSGLTDPVQAAQTFAGKVTYVSDGDTLWVQPAAGGRARKLRLEGIDAPEICQEGGEASRAALVRRVLHQQVEVSVRLNDSYGRGLARIGLNGEDVGAHMVREGQAWSYRWRNNPGPYAAEEAAARQSRRGLFAHGQAEIPRDFRQRHGSCHLVRP